MEGYIWLGLIVIGIVIEAISAQFLSIWFVFGFTGGLISYYFGAPLYLQIVIAIVVSVLSLILTKPLMKKYVMNSGNVATNSDKNIGREGIVTAEINNLDGRGRVKIGGISWSAFSEDKDIIPEGQKIKVLKIEGNKLCVKKCDTVS